MYENEETKDETNLSIDIIIDNYKKKYLNTEELPKNDFTESLSNRKNNNENCHDIKVNFTLSELIKNIKNDENIYISNISNDDEFIKFYDKLFSLKYKNNNENIKQLYDFILSQSVLNENDNIIKSKKSFVDFMGFVSLCGGTDNIVEIKHQCGKDINRGICFLNDKILSFNGNDNNYKKCDDFNLEIMEEMKKQNFQNIDKINDFLIYIDIITNQTLMNTFTFDVMNLIIRNLNDFMTLFYHYPKSELSVNSFILVENNKLQVHRIKHCYIYNSVRITDDDYADSNDAFERGLKPDGIFTVYVIFDLLKNEYYIKDYLLKVNPKINISINENINNENINNENMNNENINKTKYEKFKETISENKGSTAAVGTLLTLGALSAIPIALLLGGKKTRRRNRNTGGKERKIKTRHRRQRQTKNKKYKNKNRRTMRH
jgi:hypothetical protein